MEKIKYRGVKEDHDDKVVSQENLGEQDIATFVMKFDHESIPI